MAKRIKEIRPNETEIKKYHRNIDEEWDNEKFTKVPEKDDLGRFAIHQLMKKFGREIFYKKEGESIISEPMQTAINSWVHDCADVVLFMKGSQFGKHCKHSKTILDILKYYNINNIVDIDV